MILTFPRLSALVAFVFLGERPSLRLVAAAYAVLGGIALATLRR